MNMTLLSQIREANKSFLAGAPKEIENTGDPFVVVACIDPRLTGLLSRALGLPRYRALLIRNAGNRIIRSCQESLRSLAVAVYIKGAREILLLGHTDCIMATFSAAQLIENFRSAGIPRSAFGEGDLREWFGAISDVKSNVLEGVATLRSCGIFSQRVKIHGAIIDTNTGALTVIHDADVDQPVLSVEKAAALPAPAAKVLPEVAIRAEGKTEPAVPIAQPPGRPPGHGDRKGPLIIPAMTARSDSAKNRPPASLMEATAILADFFGRESNNPDLISEITDFRNLLIRERNPIPILKSLEKLVREHVSRYPQLPGALEYLARNIDSKGASSAKFIEMLRLIFTNLQGA